MNTPSQAGFANMTSKEYFKSLKVVHGALVSGVVFFLVISIVLQLNGYKNFGKDVVLMMLALSMLFAAGGVVASAVLFKRKLNELDPQDNLSNKLVFYRSAQVVKYALLEAPSFFCIVFFMLTGNYVILVVLAVPLFLLIKEYPNKERCINDLSLSLKESDKLNDPNWKI